MKKTFLFALGFMMALTPVCSLRAANVLELDAPTDEEMALDNRPEPSPTPVVSKPKPTPSPVAKRPSTRKKNRLDTIPRKKERRL